MSPSSEGLTKRRHSSNTDLLSIYETSKSVSEAGRNSQDRYYYSDYDEEEDDYDEFGEKRRSKAVSELLEMKDDTSTLIVVAVNAIMLLLIITGLCLMVTILVS
jgi:hypothetical protein